MQNIKVFYFYIHQVIFIERWEDNKRNKHEPRMYKLTNKYFYLAVKYIIICQSIKIRKMIKILIRLRVSTQRLLN